MYISDVAGHGLVIVNGCRISRLEGDVFEPQEEYSNHTIAGESFHLADGVIGMALSPIRPDGDRYLAFRPLASRSLYAASTRSLKSSAVGSPVNYHRAIDILPSQAVTQVFSSKGVLFYGLTREIAIGCWNINNPLRPEYFVRNLQSFYYHTASNMPENHLVLNAGIVVILYFKSSP